MWGSNNGAFLLLGTLEQGRINETVGTDVSWTRLVEQMYHGRDCGNRCIMDETVGTDVSWVTTVPRAAWEIGKDQQSVSIFAG